MNCLIVDDEALARKLLTDYVQKIEGLKLIGVATNALEAKNILSNQKVDLLFLDIQMPNLTGIELLKILKDPPITILTTAYSEYALEGYQLNVIDYLLKPIAFERFYRAVAKSIDYFKLSQQSIESSVATSEKGDYFFVKSDSKIVKVDFPDILHIEGMREYVRIHTLNEKIITLISLQKLLDTLPQSNFTRIHKSFIINIDHIKSVQGNAVSIGNDVLPVSKTYRDSFLKKINSSGLI